MFLTDAQLSLIEADTYAAHPEGEVYAVGCDLVTIRRFYEFDVVSVRGTDNPQGWISDFKIVGCRSARHPDFGQCESGFLEGAIAVWQLIGPRLGDKPLLMQGHSRGAGMLPILAGLAIAANLRVAYCVGWEMPWAVGWEMRDFLMWRGMQGIQYWYGDDPVPTIPAVPWLVPNVWKYRYIGEWMLDPFDCHSMARISAWMNDPNRPAL